MSFQSLYDWVQTQSPKISTNDVKQKILDSGHASRIDERWYGFNPTILRGVVVRGPLKINAGLLTDEKEFLICLSRLSGKHERRFFLTKELMHIFDEDELRVRDGGTLEAQLAYLARKGVSSHASKAEVRAFWRALAILCPEKDRQEFIADQERLKPYDMAARLRIPEGVVASLLHDEFLNEIK